MNINNKVIDNHLKFESERFRNECFNIYKTLVDGNIKTAIQNSYDELYKKIDSELKNNIMKSIGGKDLYDYSEIRTPEIFEYIDEDRDIDIYRLSNENLRKFKTINEKLKYIGEYYQSYNQSNIRGYDPPGDNYYRNIIEKNILDIKVYNNYINNEVIICGYNRQSEKKYGENGTPFPNECIKGCLERCDKIIKIHYIFLTNYGRLIEYLVYGEKNNNNPSYPYMPSSVGLFTYKYTAFDFWIPTDYIRILQLTKPDNIEEVLKCMKDTLYNRKIVPLYVKEIVERNEVLESKYEEYEKGNEKYIKDKEEFEKETKPYVDLYKDKEDLHKLREELKLEKDKLKLVAIKLEMDKKKFEEDMAMIKDMNISDILNK